MWEESIGKKVEGKRREESKRRVKGIIRYDRTEGKYGRKKRDGKSGKVRGGKAK